ncbi:MAG: hypothetical protein WBW41_15515 [Verrucomicrobiia bacterium]
MMEKRGDVGGGFAAVQEHSNVTGDEWQVTWQKEKHPTSTGLRNASPRQDIERRTSNPNSNGRKEAPKTQINERPFVPFGSHEFHPRHRRPSRLHFISARQTAVKITCCSIFLRD